MSVNKVILIGNVGNKPEVKYLDNGVAVCTLPIATNETYTNKNGEKVVQTEWHNVVLWRKLAEIVEKYVDKGDLLYIEGKIRTRSWEDKDGNKRYTTEVYANNMNMLGSRKSSEEKNTVKDDIIPDKQNDMPEIEDPSDDLPF